MLRRLWIAFLVLSLAVYAGSFYFDAFTIEGPEQSAFACPSMLLFFGWFGIFGGAVAWFANPILFMSWIFLLFGMSRTAFWLAGAALLTALTFLNIDTILISEAPTFRRVTGIGAAYWLWLASMGLAMAAGLTRAIAQAAARRTSKQTAL